MTARKDLNNKLLSSPKLEEDGRTLRYVRLYFRKEKMIEQLIFQYVRSNQPVSCEEIVNKLGLELSEVSDVINKLILERKLRLGSSGLVTR